MKLTKKGKKYVKSLEKEHQEEIKQIEDVLESIKPIIGNRKAISDAVYSPSFRIKEEAEDRNGSR